MPPSYNVIEINADEVRSCCASPGRAPRPRSRWPTSPVRRSPPAGSSPHWSASCATSGIRSRRPAARQTPERPHAPAQLVQGPARITALKSDHAVATSDGTLGPVGLRAGRSGPVEHRGPPQRRRAPPPGRCSRCECRAGLTGGGGEVSRGPAPRVADVCVGSLDGRLANPSAEEHRRPLVTADAIHAAPRRQVEARDAAPRSPASRCRSARSPGMVRPGRIAPLARVTVTDGRSAVPVVPSRHRGRARG